MWSSPTLTHGQTQLGVWAVSAPVAVPVALAWLSSGGVALLAAGVALLTAWATLGFLGVRNMKSADQKSFDGRVHNMANRFGRSNHTQQHSPSSTQSHLANAQHRRWTM